MHSITLAQVFATLALLIFGGTAQRASALKIQRDATPSVIGRVQDPAGNPLARARVVIAELGRATTTEDDGAFVFRGLRPGTYHVDATLLGYAPGHEEIRVTEDGSDVHVVLILRITPLTLSGVQVTASVTGEDPLRLTQATVQLTGKELGRNLGATVAQTLAKQPGISTRYGGPAASLPVIRGLTGERILMLQDGQRSGDLASTSPDHALSIDPLASTQIEVVRGPASILYGNNALGGVVNVISHDIPASLPTSLEGYVAGQAESVNPGAALSGAVRLPVGQSVALAMRGGWRSMEDVRTGNGGRLDNTQFRNLNGTIGLGYIHDHGAAGMAYRGYDFSYGLPSAPGDEEAGVRIDGARHQATLRADLALATAGLINLRLDGSAQWYRHDEVEPDGEVATTFDLQTQTIDLLAQTRFGPVRGAVGVSGMLKQYTPTGEEALTPPASSTSGGVLLYQEVALGRRAANMAPRLQLGLRYDRYRIEGEDGGDRFDPPQSRTFQNVSGSAGLNIPVTEGVSASISLARAFRAPTVEELFSSAFHAAVGSFDIGNADLAAETNEGIEGVLRAQTESVSAQAAVYYNRIDDYIAPTLVGDTLIVDEGETSRVPLNVFQQANATIRGVEAQIEATVTEQIVLGAMGDVLRGKFESDAPLPFMPTARVGAALRWDNGRYSAGMDVRHALAQDEVPENELATDEYTLVDLSAGATLMRDGRVHSITVRADNVFDVLYREPTSRIKAFAPNPGRNLTLVYRLLF